MSVFNGKLEEVDISEYKPFDLNWKNHPSTQRKMFRNLMKEVGFVATIVVNKRTHHILDGHMRVEEAKKQGIKKLPAVVLDIDEETEAKIVATFDMIGRRSNHKKTELTKLLEQIDFEDPELNAEFQRMLKKERLALEAQKAPIMKKDYNYIVLVFKDKYNWVQAMEEFGLQNKKYVEEADTVMKIKVADGDEWAENKF